MEGYFVRTLGMHRVYNSAFMVMLRDEDNAKYRSVIKNTLEFDPDIMKRYVNFMSNPDERTAIDQFGKGDKCFGVATMMATLPGLPMFGHGQIEGFTEKYGMDVLDLLAQQVEESGVRTVEGSMVGDDSFYLDEPYATSWAWNDLQWSYGAPVSALSFNENTIELTVTPDAATPGTTTAAWIPDVDYFTLDNSMTPAPPGQPANPGLDRRPGNMMVRAWGTVPAEGFHAALTVDDPADFTAAAFKQALLSRGVTVNGSSVSRHKLSTGTADFAEERAQPLKLVPSDLSTVAAPLDGRKVLARRVSVPVAQDIAVIDKASQNLHAELLLRLLGKVHGIDGSFAQGARVVRQFLLDAGINDADFFFYDGSGLSADDRMAPRAFTQLLAYASRQPWGAAWRETLPVAGVDGTLIDRFRSSPLKGRLWAKTGTHNEANALSGYLTAASGKTLAFSILVNGHRPGSDAELHAIDRIAEAIAAAN